MNLSGKENSLYLLPSVCSIVCMHGQRQLIGHLTHGPSNEKPMTRMAQLNELKGLKSEMSFYEYCKLD